MAITSTVGGVTLVDAATHQEVADLSPRSAGVISHINFSPNGAYLAITTESCRIFLWDMLSVRRKLRELGLDWDDSDSLLNTTPPFRKNIQIIDANGGIQRAVQDSLRWRQENSLVGEDSKMMTSRIGRLVVGCRNLRR